LLHLQCRRGDRPCPGADRTLRRFRRRRRGHRDRSGRDPARRHAPGVRGAAERGGAARDQRRRGSAGDGGRHGLLIVAIYVAGSRSALRRGAADRSAETDLLLPGRGWVLALTVTWMAATLVSAAFVWIAF